MLKSVLIPTGLVLALPFLLQAGPTHIMVEVKPPLEIENVRSDGALTLKKSVRDPSGKQILQASRNASAQLTNAVISFRTNRDGRVAVMYFSALPKWGGRSTAVANIRINGEPIANSDYSKLDPKTGLPAGFVISPTPERQPEIVPAADGRPAMLRSSMARPVKFFVPVKAGETVTVSADLLDMEMFPNEAEAWKSRQNK